MKKTEKILITSALPYANGPLHIGHMVEYIQTDVYTRFLKLTGKNAVYVCADDTHGTPIEVNAAKAGKKPEEFIKHWYDKHVKDMKSYLVKHDSYYSTHSKESKHFTELIYNRLKKKGLIYKKEMDLMYCEHDKRFLPDRYVKGVCPKCGASDQYGDQCEKCGTTYTPVDLIKSYCSICQNKPVVRKSEHYFFKLGSFSGKLKKYIEKGKFQPEIKNQILNWIKDGLDDWCISRDAPYFGFKIPGETKKYFYVWLDAPIGYMASLANYLKKDVKKADKYWNDAEVIHFIGKDIIYFHLLFWPAVLMGSGFTPADNVVVHGFLNINGEKMSKSRGTFITAVDFLKAANPEFLRYYLTANLTHSMTDLDLDTENFKSRINNELVANIANFVYRTLSFVNSKFDSKLTTVRDTMLLNEIVKRTDKVKKAYETFEFREVIKQILEISSLGNKYFQDNAPWDLIKRNKEETQQVLTDCVNLVKVLSIIVKPILPEFSKNVEKQLNIKKQSWNDIGKKLENQKIGKAQIVLKKIEKLDLDIPDDEPVDRKFSIEVEPDLEKKGIKILGAVISNFKVKKKNTELEKAKKELTGKIKKQKYDNKIIKAYHDIYRKHGLKDKHNSVQFREWIDKKGQIPQINTVVDAYNIIATKHFVSAGCHDVSMIKGSKLKYVVTKGKEKYTTLGTSKTKTLSKGENAFVDNEKVLCWYDLKQGDETKITDKSKSCLLYVQGNKEISYDYLHNALEEMCKLITKINGGSYEIIGEDPFSKLNLKVGKIVSVSEHYKADKLLLINVDMKDEKIQLVAGLKPFYKNVNTLVGKNLIVVTNLEHANLRGETSQGMLLAAESPDSKTVEVLEAPNSKPGDRAFIDGISSGKETIKFDDFIKVEMYVKDSKVFYKGKQLQTKKDKIITKKVKKGKVR